MHPVTNDTLISQLKWRYATKAFDSSKKIPDTDWKTLEEALVLTPSSYGLQLWKFFVVTDPTLRAKLPEHAWGQKQVVDASHLVVLSVKTDIVAGDVEKYVKRIAEVRGVPENTLDEYKGMMLGSISGKSHEALREWGSRQVYIALGTILTSAAMLGIDACPMEGFSSEKFDEILGIGAKGYTSRVLCPLGYRSSADGYAKAPKVRFPNNQVVEYL